MKKSILALGLLLSVNAFAAPKVLPGEELLKVKCEDQKSHVKYSITISSNVIAYNADGATIPATFTILRLKDLCQEVLYRPVAYQGVFGREDVMYLFHDGRTVNFTLYADELDQTVLTFTTNGQASEMRLTCEY